MYRSDDVPTPTNDLAVSRSGRLLFTTHNDGICRVWDTLRGNIVETMTNHDQRFSCVKISQDGHSIALGTWDSSIRVKFLSFTIIYHQSVFLQVYLQVWGPK